MPFTSDPGLETYPALSPGCHLAYVASPGEGGNRDIYVRQVEAGTPIRLTNAPASDIFPAWSPDGSYLAFLQSAQGKKEILVIPAFGGPERRVAELSPQRGTQNAGLSWSPTAAFWPAWNGPKRVPTRSF